ncbi:MAG: M20/M25/M40 family metallo-hydrolase, partial [Candidatus Paceibacterales bacterium]
MVFFQISLAVLFSPIEKQIQNNAIREQDAALALLEQLVNINSGTANFTGVHQVGDVLRKQFEELGFKTRWIESSVETHRAGTFLAERKGPAGAKRLLLLGHLDTVFSLSSPFQHFRRHGNVATGPGIVDAKGGDVVILSALKALQAAKALENTSITVLLTPDAENVAQPTSLSRKPLLQAAQHADVALDFEGSLGLGTSTIARRGTSYWEIKTKDALGTNRAVFELARILNTMRIELEEEDYLSFSSDAITGPVKSDLMVTAAFAKGNLSFLTEKQRKKVEDKIQAIVQQNLPGTTAVVRFQDGISAMKPTQQDKNLLKNYSQVSIDLGYGVVKPLPSGLRDPADISYIAGSMPANLSGLGPV